MIVDDDFMLAVIVLINLFRCFLVFASSLRLNPGMGEDLREGRSVLRVISEEFLE